MAASPEQFILQDEPDWHSAAQELITGLYSFQTREHKIELLEAMCLQLGDRLYPAFLQILYIINRKADANARSLVSATLVDCLQSGRLPSGKLAAWGSSSYTGDSAFGQSRSLGPIEFVCAWYAQPSTERPISQQQFSNILDNLLSLVASNDKARALYCHKLLSDAEDPLGGSLSNLTRVGLSQMSNAWLRHSPTDNHRAVVDAFLDALQSASLLNQPVPRPF